MIFEEKYETCIFMARVAQFIIAAFEEDDYDVYLYEKVNRVITKLDSNKRATGFIGPQTPCRVIKKLVEIDGTSRFAFGFLWLKGFFTRNPHIAYQEWCRELYEAHFSVADIEEINRVSKLGNHCYDELGSRAWRMLLKR